MAKNDNAHSLRLTQSLAKHVGNAEGIFRELFGYSVRVRLLDSIKRGGSECVIEVEW